jgi:P4 family phage/plasmid primase-like protien
VTKRVEVTEADRAAYDALDEAERERIDRYVDRIVASEVAALDALPRPWVEGAGWDAGVHRSACALLQLAQSPWNAYTAEQAYAAVVSHAPTDSQWTAEHVNAKWLAAVKSVAGKIKPFPEKPIDISDFETDSDVADAPAASPETKSEFPPVSWFFDKDTGLDVDRVSRWVLKTNDLARGVDGKIWGYNDGVWHRDEDAIARTVAKILTGRYRNSHVANVQRYVELQLETIYCRPVPGYMNFLNGMLDWRTGVLLPHQRELHSTIQFPYNWNEDAQCPQFDKFLAQVLSEDYIKLAWEMLGYLLYSGNNLQTAFLFLGTGQNGKGTLMRVIEGLLGEGNYSSQSLDSLNTNKFSPANLFGKIANIAGDIDATYQESTASFKKLTGEDTYSGEFKYGAAFNFESWAVPLFSANKIPGSADVSEGYLRRWVVLEFNRHISNAERKAGLSNLLLAELPGIAAKAVRALRPLQERGHFAPEGEAIRGKERFADAIDQVRQWVEECTIAAPDHRETRNNLYISYTNWSHRTGGGKLKASEFYERLVNLGYEHKVVRGQRFITGLVMAPATMDGSGQESDTQAQEADF